MLLICYKRCSTCKQVESMLKEKNIGYDYRNIDSENPTYEELKSWHEKSGLDIKKFFNTSGMIYREENIKDKLETMSLDEKYKLLATNGLLVKRPILIDGDKILVGPQVKKYIENEL
ncbi:Spx/MgsR family RNA polymerase-binding regulatory protein [Peptoniphilaceae bacterium SGI.131]